MKGSLKESVTMTGMAWGNRHNETRLRRPCDQRQGTTPEERTVLDSACVLRNVAVDWPSLCTISAQKLPHNP